MSGTPFDPALKPCYKIAPIVQSCLSKEFTMTAQNKATPPKTTASKNKQGHTLNQEDRSKGGKNSGGGKGKTKK